MTICLSGMRMCIMLGCISLLYFSATAQQPGNPSPVRDTAAAKSNEKKLKEVEVKAQAVYIKQTASTISIDLSQIKEAKLWTLADALKQLPGITIDEHGTILYSGKPIALKMNGFANPTLARIMPERVFSQMANTYSNITIQLHDLRTEQPTLDLTVAPPKQDGVYATLGTDISTLRQGIDGNASVRTGRNLFGINAGYAHNRLPGIETNADFLYHNSPVRLTRGSNMISGNRNTYSFGFSDNFQLSKRHTLNIDGQFAGNTSDRKDQINTTEYRSDTIDRRSVSYLGTTGNGSGNASYSGRIAYIWKLPATGKGTTRRLDLSAEYSENQTAQTSNMMSEILKGVAGPNDDYAQERTTSNKEQYYFGNFGLGYKKAGKLDFAAKYFVRGYEDYQGMNYIKTSKPFTRQENSNTYNYAAALVSYEKNLSKSISGRLVVKMDYNDNVLNNTGEHFYSSGFQPYLSMLYNIRPGHSLRLESEYAKQRPPLYALTSVQEIFNNGYTIRVGNPYLKPANTFTANLNYVGEIKKNRITIDLKYNHTGNEISYYSYALDSIQYLSYTNLKGVNGGYSRASYSFNLFKKVSTTLSGWLDYSSFRDQLNISSDALSRGAGVSFMYTYKLNWRLMLTTDYSHSNGYQREGYDAFRTMLMGTYAKGKWRLTCAATNLQQPWFISSTGTATSSYYSFSTMRMQTYDVRVGVYYTLGKMLRSGDKGKDIDKNDMGAIQQ